MPTVNDPCSDLIGESVTLLWKPIQIDCDSLETPDFQAQLALVGYGTQVVPAPGGGFYHAPNGLIQNYSSLDRYTDGDGCLHWRMKTCPLPANEDTGVGGRALPDPGSVYRLSGRIGGQPFSFQFSIDAGIDYALDYVDGAIPLEVIETSGQIPVLSPSNSFSQYVAAALDGASVASLTVGELTLGQAPTQPMSATTRAWVEQAIAALSGNHVGDSTTYAGLPTTDSDGGPLDVGDISSLKQDDGGNLKGFYRWNGTTWVLSLAVPNDYTPGFGLQLTGQEFRLADDLGLNDLDGSRVTGDIDVNGNRVTGAADGILATDLATVGQTEANNTAVIRGALIATLADSFYDTRYRDADGNLPDRNGSGRKATVEGNVLSLDHDGEHYLRAVNNPGNKVQAGGAASNTVETSDMSVRFDIRFPDITPVSDLRAINGSSYILNLNSSGVMTFYYVETTNGYPAAAWSLAEHGIADNERNHLRFDVVVAPNGAASFSLYKRDPGPDLADDSGWNLVSTKTLTGRVPKKAANLGFINGNNATAYYGEFDLFRLLALSDGQVDGDFFPDRDADAGASAWTSPNGETWTINRSAAGRKMALVTAPVDLMDGSGFWQLDEADKPAFGLQYGSDTRVVLHRPNQDSVASDRVFSASLNNSFRYMLYMAAGSVRPRALVETNNEFVQAAGGLGPVVLDLSMIAAIVDNGFVSVFDDINGVQYPQDMSVLTAKPEFDVPRVYSRSYTAAGDLQPTGELFASLNYGSRSLSELELKDLKAFLQADRSVSPFGETAFRVTADALELAPARRISNALPGVDPSDLVTVGQLGAQVTTAQVLNLFGAVSTGATPESGTANDWDAWDEDAGTQARLLLGSDTNGPTPGSALYFHCLLFKYHADKTNNADGNNVTQLAIPYGAAHGVHYRTRTSGTWEPWVEIGSKSRYHYTTGNYSPDANDAGGVVEINSTSTRIVTIQPNVFPLYTHLEILRMGSGGVTLAEGSGVVFRSKDGMKKIGSQFSGVTLFQRTTNDWVIIGDLIA